MRKCTLCGECEYICEAAVDTTAHVLDESRETIRQSAAQFQIFPRAYPLSMGKCCPKCYSRVVQRFVDMKGVQLEKVARSVARLRQTALFCDTLKRLDLVSVEKAGETYPLQLLRGYQFSEIVTAAIIMLNK